MEREEEQMGSERLGCDEKCVSGRGLGVALAIKDKNGS